MIVCGSIKTLRFGIHKTARRESHACSCHTLPQGRISSTRDTLAGGRRQRKRGLATAFSVE
ncbi:hypothetical protein HSB1_19520 [Halogranum salarium B-1]|uniref:Uncharacterized protein n=1 Tax=Halogranum salarium B-1 TaxID=1210908 RepID=J3JG36_9EURY|nr:hypothetical protein HSB1_19520 [Halogranum salarium B-1]